MNLVPATIRTITRDGSKCRRAVARDRRCPRKTYKGWIPAIVEIELDDVLGEGERMNISLPKRIIRRLDAQAGRRR